MNVAAPLEFSYPDCSSIPLTISPYPVASTASLDSSRVFNTLQTLDAFIFVASFVFNIFQTLCTKIPGWWVPRQIPPRVCNIFQTLHPNTQIIPESRSSTFNDLQTLAATPKTLCTQLHIKDHISERTI
jgi:hypothetical protein